MRTSISKEAQKEWSKAIHVTAHFFKAPGFPFQWHSIFVLKSKNLNDDKFSRAQESQLSGSYSQFHVLIFEKHKDWLGLQRLHGDVGRGRAEKLDQKPET